jgi:diguanylate cyclase (GGDEF)-like protein/PAS domain S-box-containing protein
MFRLSLKYRIAAAIFLLEAALVGLMLWSTLSLSFESSRIRQQGHEEAVLRPLLELSRIALLNDEYTELQTYISFVPKTDGALRILLEDASGRVVAGSDLNDTGKPPPVLVDAGDAFWRTIEVGKGAGRLHVQFSDGMRRRSNEQVVRLGVGTAAVGITIIALIGLGMGQLLTRRMVALQHAAQCIAQGDLNVEVATTGHDEIAELGRAFDRMVTMLRKQFIEIEESRERFSLAVSGTNDGIWDWEIEQGRTFFSARFKGMLGFAEDDPAFPANFQSWRDCVHPDDIAAVIGRLLDHLEGRADFFECEHRVRNKSGEYLWALMRGRARFNDIGEPTRLAGSFSDITVRKQAEEKILHQSLHDTLTGLPNRTLLEDRLQHAMHMARRHATAVTVIMMDLNQFKEINDTLGHLIGDAVLKETARRVLKAVRPSDTFSRFGGDEFVLLLPETNAEQAVIVISKIKEVLAAEFTVDGHRLLIRSSIGGAIYPRDGDSAATLIQRADVAMYHSKRGNLDYCFYDTTQDHCKPGRLVMIGALHRAIGANELELHFQPKLDLRTGEWRGAEALVRWNHPERGLLSPIEFIPLAEECGLIVPLTEWVLDNALRQQKAWRESGVDIEVAVNLSTRTLRSLALPDNVQRMLNAYSVPAQSLWLEITESAIMEDPVTALSVLKKLNALGIRLSIDDFGTGYSSLTYLKQLPVNEVKIDRTFVFDMLRDSNSLAIVGSTIDLGHQLGISVIAEGVEETDVLEKLKVLECDAAQGFVISKPVRADEFLRRFKERTRGEIGAVAAR